MAKQPANDRAHQNGHQADDESARVDGRKQGVDIGGVLAAGLQGDHVGILHEPQRQNGTGKAEGEQDVADEQQLAVIILAQRGHPIGQDAEQDVGSKGQHKVAGDEEKQPHDQTHDGDAAELLQFGRQQHVDAARDQRRDGRQKDVGHTRQQQRAGKGGDGDQHKVDSRKHADGDQIRDGKFVVGLHKYPLYKKVSTS